MSIKRRKVRDGVIVAEQVTLELSNASAADAIALFREIMPTGAEMIESQRSWAQSLIDSGITGSRAKYARNVVTSARLATDAIGTDDADRAVVHVMNMMRSAWRIDVKAVEPQIVTGTRQRRGGDKGRETKSEAIRKRNQEWQRLANQHWAKHASWNVSEVARHIDLTRERTIRRVIKKLAT